MLIKLTWFFIPFALMFLYIIPVQVMATVAVWRSAQITNELGLSNSAVNTVYQDIRGFMWFGTWDGLNRYDGKNIKTFYPDPFDEHSISNNIIRNILEDKDGNLWIVTERGIDKYSHDLENFQSWFIEYAELSFREQSLQAQIGPNGNIWVNAYGLGLFSYHPIDNEFRKAEIPAISESHTGMIADFYFFENRIYLMEKQILTSWVSYKNKLSEVVDLSNILPHNAGEPQNYWFFSFENQPYLARTFSKGGLQVINLDNIEYFAVNIADPTLRITTLASSADETFLWIGTDDGNIYMYYPENNTLKSVSQKIPGIAGKRVKIWSILETPDDLLWVGTDGEGVFRTIMKPKPFYQIQKGEPAQRQLNHQIVRAIYEDEEGNLWVGTRGNGLNFIPYASGPTRHYTTDNGLTNNAVLSIQKDNNKNLWIGHDGSGIDLLDMETGRFFHFPRDLNAGEHLEFGSVYAICIDVFGQIWLGTSGYGVIGLDISKRNNAYYLNKFRHIKSESVHDVLKSNIVYAIEEEVPNILWLATRGAGIYRMNTLSGELENYGVTDSGQVQLINNDVLSLHMAKNGILWVGSSGGLTKININYTPSYSFENYTTRSGLPNNTIHAILEDSEGKIWLSTNKGLSKFDPEQEIFLNFNSADGLQSNEYTDGAACFGQKTRRFYFGGINGLDWFYPQDIVISQRMPQLIFNAFRLNNKLILPGDSTMLLSKNINELDKITLKHHQNFFTIEFTTLNFINPNNPLFQYKLENFNSQWVMAGNLREASFTNVPFGKYRLLVRATNEDGVWSDEVKALQIIILPPFWKTWQAFLMYALLVLLGIYLLYQYQTRRLHRKQQRTLEKLHQEKEKELNQYKLQFFTNLAHEFGTPLTLIFASAASLLNTGRSQAESSKLIKTIYQNSKRMQRLVQELLEFRKIDTGREKLCPVKTELVSTINNIAEIFSHFARENELEISFEPEVYELWVMIDTRKLEKIMLNLLSNAIKYTPAGGRVRISLAMQEEKIKISVSDTGVGIADESLPNIFESFYQQIPEQQRRKNGFKGIGIGLSYTKSLVDLLGGIIEVDSKPGKGSTFTILLPCNAIYRDTSALKPIDSSIIRSRLLESITEDMILEKPEDKLKLHARPKLWTTPKKYRILVAEDDTELSNLLFKLLSEQYDISLARDGQQAMEIINNSRIDLVVSDIMMPRMDGLSLCKTIKADMLTSHIPVILLTARVEMENRIEGLEMGADSYIPKPFHPKHLFVRIEKLLKAREQVSEYFKANFGTPSYDLQQNFSLRDKELLGKCIDFIESRYTDENMDADRLASHLALSKAQLYRKVKALTGLTPHGLIKNFRLKKARQMIADREHSVSDIIFMVGFNNRTYFYRSYKEVFGETPGEINKT